MTEKRPKRARAIAWLDAVSVGSLATSACFYWAYDQWKPLAASAGCVAVVKVIQHLMLATDPYA